jgi:crotonobetainyl-CoA:carnitine CoA-transferase CaiB-like acyl-CoA transferase
VIFNAREDKTTLTGIQVLDLTRLLPGAFCTMLLADLGADVVKVEEPGRGDYMRWYPPLHEGQSVLFNALNRNKRSVTLYLKQAEGREAFLRLAARADAVVEGNRPGVMDRLGLGWEALHEANPSLVMCSITGYGQHGPWAQRAGHDLNYMALAGALGLNGPRGGDPHPLAVQVADIGAGGQGAATAILAALLDVARGGVGRHLDVSMTDGAISWLAVALAQQAAEGAVGPRAMQRLTGRYACYRVYRCADGGHMSVGALEPKFWEALCQTLDRLDLVAEQYAEGESQDRLHEQMEAIFATRPRADWETLLGGSELCCEPVLELHEVAGHPHVRHRGLIETRPSGLEVAPAVPQGDGWRRRDAPGLGQHTSEVLAEAGLDAADLERLRARGAV